MHAILPSSKTAEETDIIEIHEESGLLTCRSLVHVLENMNQVIGLFSGVGKIASVNSMVYVFSKSQAEEYSFVIHVVPEEVADDEEKRQRSALVVYTIKFNEKNELQSIVESKKEPDYPGIDPSSEYYYPMFKDVKYYREQIIQNPDPSIILVGLNCLALQWPR